MPALDLPQAIYLGGAVSAFCLLAVVLASVSFWSNRPKR